MTISPLFDELRQNNTPLQEYPEHLRSLLVSQIDLTLNSGNSNDIKELRLFISKLLRLTFDAAPVTARRAMSDRLSKDSPERQAFLLGGLTFAEALIINISDAGGMISTYQKWH